MGGRLSFPLHVTPRQRTGGNEERRTPWARSETKYGEQSEQTALGSLFPFVTWRPSPQGSLLPKQTPGILIFANYDCACCALTVLETRETAVSETKFLSCGFCRQSSFIINKISDTNGVEKMRQVVLQRVTEVCAECQQGAAGLQALVSLQGVIQMRFGR